MAKAKKAETNWDKSNIREYMVTNRAAAMVNGGSENSATAAAVDIGIRMPHLSARYLLQRSSFPFERTVVIFGPSGTNKSGLLYWFYNLYREAGGYYLHIDAEDKDTPILRLSLTGYDENAGEAIQCLSIDDYQTKVQHYINWYKKECAKEDGPKKRYPIIIGIDSLVAKLTADAAKKIDAADGVTGRRFADEARALADWFKLIPEKLQGYPLCLAAVNHDKPKADQHTGATIHHTPGGTAPNFFATYKILTARVKKLKQTVKGWEGNRIRLSMEKNSLAADNRSVDVELVWRVGSGKSRSGNLTTVQKTIWNWDKATTELLYNLCSSETRQYHGRRGKVANEMIGVQKASGGRYYSAALGVTRTDPLPAAEFGRLVETRRDIIDLLEAELGIHGSIEYVPGEDYDVQRTAARLRVDDIMPADDEVSGITVDGDDDVTE